MTDQKSGWSSSDVPRSMVVHGSVWFDTGSGVKKVFCEHHDCWHERHEAKVECGLDSVFGTLPG